MSTVVTVTAHSWGFRSLSATIEGDQYPINARLTDDPPLLIQSHPVTGDLAKQPSPLNDPAYKHREDLIDALLCALDRITMCATALTDGRSSACPPNPQAPGGHDDRPARPKQRLQPLLNPHCPRRERALVR